MHLFTARRIGRAAIARVVGTRLSRKRQQIVPRSAHLVSRDGVGNVDRIPRGTGAPSIDTLRADLAESRLLERDLSAKLAETRARLADAEGRLAAGSGSATVEEAAARALETQRSMQQTIDRLTRELNAMHTKARMMQAHNDLLTEQEREMRGVTDRFVLTTSLFVSGLVALVAAEWAGLTDVLGAFLAKKMANWTVDAAAGRACPAP